MGQSGSTRIFLTKIDHHHPKPLKEDSLRSYIMMHALFSKQLTCGDSQFLNNRRLRTLLHSRGGDRGHRGRLMNDLSLLLREGYFVPAIRHGRSLLDVRKEQEERGVEGIPPIEYVEYVVEQLNGQGASYDVGDVSRLFKQRVMHVVLSFGRTERGGLPKRVVERICEYVEGQDTLLYNSLRGWLREKVDDTTFSQRDYRLVDGIIGDVYRHNVPLSMEIGIDVPVKRGTRLEAPDLCFGDRTQYDRRVQESVLESVELPPLVFLSHSYLRKLPAEALVEIKGSRDGKTQPEAHYSKIVNSLGRWQDGKKIKFDRFCHNLEQYLLLVERVGLDYMSGCEKSSYLAEKKAAKKRAKVYMCQDVWISSLSFLSGNPLLGFMCLMWAGYGGLQRLQEAACNRRDQPFYICGNAFPSERLFVGIHRGSGEGVNRLE